MLRRCFFSSPLVATTFVAAAAAASPAALSSARNVFVFTEQNPVLQNNAKHLKYKSPVWIEEDDMWIAEKAGTKLKADQRPTETAVKRLIEYYNLDSLLNKEELEKDLPSEQVMTSGMHTSWKSRMPFRGAIGQEFEQAALLHGYTSKFWVSTMTAKKEKYPLRRGTKPTSVVFSSTGRLYNAEQFEDADAISKCPMSGMKRKPYGGDFRAALEKDIAANKYSTGLYFTLNQLEHLGLAGDLRPDAVAVQLHLTQLRGTLQLYNLDEVEGGAKLAEDLQRFPVDSDTFLVSGRPVRDEKTLASMKAAGAKSRYWVSERDLVQRSYALKEGATGVPFQGFQGGDRQQQFTILMYNAEQLQNPKRAFELAGTKGML